MGDGHESRSWGTVGSLSPHLIVTTPSHHPSLSCFRVVLSCFCVGCHLCSLLPGLTLPLPGPQTIVRGSKGAKDGALTLLLDEFENMSVTRSNSLRRDSPPPPARAHQENGVLEERAAPARVAADKAGGRTRATGHSEAGSGDRRRVGPEKRPKSSREGPGGPQDASRDKRPLSGPDVSTPQPASLASGAKLAAGRPFNTYPRADTDHPPRGAQVTPPPLQHLSVLFPCFPFPSRIPVPCAFLILTVHVCHPDGELMQPPLIAPPFFLCRGSHTTWPLMGHQPRAWLPLSLHHPPGLPPEPVVLPAQACWAPMPLSPSWLPQHVLLLPLLHPLPLGPLDPAHHSGNPSECPTSSSGLLCSW